VVAHSAAPTEVRCRKLGRYELQFFGRCDRFPELAEAHTLADVQRFPVVEIEPPPGQEGLVPEGARSYAVASNVASVKALVMTGFGVGDLPDFMISNEEARTLTRAQVPHDPDCGLYLVTSPQFSGRTAERMAEAVGDLLQRELTARSRTPRSRPAPQRTPVRRRAQRTG
jgi:DNA-binding transcriptional LysR family regulator